MWCGVVCVVCVCEGVSVCLPIEACDMPSSFRNTLSRCMCVRVCGGGACEGVRV